VIGIDPVLDLPLNEGSGTTVYDRSGFNNHGTVYNAVWQKIWRDWILNFNGQNAYVSCGNPVSLDFATNDFTVEVWAKAFGGTYGRGIINKGGWGAVGYFISQAYSPANRYYFGVRDSAGYKYVALPLYETWDWTHIVGVKKTNYLEAWVNGVSVGTYSGTIGSLSSPTRNFEIGRSCDSYYFNGLIGVVHIFRKALTSQQIQVLANLFRGELRKPPSL
jgi:hypothetical protein